MSSDSDPRGIEAKQGPEPSPCGARNVLWQQPSPNPDVFEDAAAEEHAKTSRPLCQDSRRCSRNRVPQERQLCELKVGPKRMPAVLLNESPSGFAVLLDSVDGLAPRNRGELHTDRGWFKVRIVYVNKAVGPANSHPKDDCRYRLGLKKARSFRLF